MLRTAPTTRIRRWLVVGLVAMLGLFACGDDDDDAATTEERTVDQADPGSSDDASDPADPAPADDSGEALFGNACSDADAPFALDYRVSGIPEDDPDGGLVVRDTPGASGDRLDVLPPDAAAATNALASGCAVLDNGDVWWFVDGAGVEGWANASYLRVDGAQEHAPKEVLCALYSVLVAEGESVPAGVANRLNAVLGFHPAGVGFSLDVLAGQSEGDPAEAIDTVIGYVGPICN